MSFAKIRPRRGTASEWSSVNPILAEGEIGIEVPDSGVGTGLVKIKFGDGVKTWNDLPYGVDSEDLPDNILTEDDIVNNAVTDDPTKAVSASVAKNLQNQVTDINNKLRVKMPDYDNLIQIVESPITESYNFTATEDGWLHVNVQSTNEAVGALLVTINKYSFVLCAPIGYSQQSQLVPIRKDDSVICALSSGKIRNIIFIPCV